MSLKFWVHKNTVCVIHSVVLFGFVFCQKFRHKLSCTVAAVSSQQPVEHVKNILQNTMTKWTPRSVRTCKAMNVLDACSCVFQFPVQRLRGVQQEIRQPRPTRHPPEKVPRRRGTRTAVQGTIHIWRPQDFWIFWPRLPLSYKIFQNLCTGCPKWAETFDLCSIILPSCPAASAKFPSAQAESGRQWNTRNPSQQNPVSSHLGHPVLTICKNWGFFDTPLSVWTWTS